MSDRLSEIEYYRQHIRDWKPYSDFDEEDAVVMIRSKQWSEDQWEDYYSWSWVSRRCCDVFCAVPWFGLSVFRCMDWWSMRQQTREHWRHLKKQGFTRKRIRQLRRSEWVDRKVAARVGNDNRPA